MGMQIIPVSAEGFLMDVIAAKAVLKSVGIEPDETADPSHPFVLHEDVFGEAKDILDEKDIECFHCSGFDGTAVCPPDVLNYLNISDKDSIAESFESDYVVMIPLDRTSELTKQAYASVDEIVDEIKQKLQDILPYFPEDYSFARQIRVLYGTTYC